ncbi:polysaccharide pyruvyl transferase family protein [Planktothricoides raciborskii]|nr:polysaccharide pyruvyl transferase family protein [Planktothricoides raciborskii]
MVQTLAALQFLPHVDYYVERRRQDTNHYAKLPKSFCIMNGWYSTGMLPPNDNIIPFYISIHISKPDVLTSAVVDHFKQHQPIGCRDSSTLALLQSKGIEAYYSGCLTLTFPTNRQKRLEGIYLVDIDEGGLELIPDDIKQRAVTIYYGTSRKLVDIVMRDQGKFIRPLMARKFDRAIELLRESLELPKVFFDPEYTSLYPKNWTEKDFTNLLHLFKARSLLNLYRNASLVITNRLHCASPCIALGTPVVFIPRQKLWAEFGSERFEVIQPYIPLNMSGSKSKIDWNPRPTNVDNHKLFLTMICQKAVEMCENPLKEIPLSYFMEESGWYPQL